MNNNLQFDLLFWTDNGIRVRALSPTGRTFLYDADAETNPKGAYTSATEQGLHVSFQDAKTRDALTGYEQAVLNPQSDPEAAA